MFCPECKTGYNKGIIKCADCGKNLVKDPPKEGSLEYVELEEVCTPIDINQVAFIKSILQSEGIKYIVQERIIIVFTAC